MSVDLGGIGGGFSLKTPLPLEQMLTRRSKLSLNLKETTLTLHHASIGRNVGTYELWKDEPAKINKELEILTKEIEELTHRTFVRMQSRESYGIKELTDFSIRSSSCSGNVLTISAYTKPILYLKWVSVIGKSAVAYLEVVPKPGPISTFPTSQQVDLTDLFAEYPRLTSLVLENEEFFKHEVDVY
jgi:hypothetical protein